IFEHGGLKFASVSNDGAVGRAVPDLTDNEGRAVRVGAEVQTEMLPSSLWARTRRVILGETPHPRAAILLAGTPGRYAAVVLSGRGDPISFEWALGERRGQALGAFPVDDDRFWLELSLEPSGELGAYAGAGKDRRLIGEPVKLGSGWKKHFGDMPIATLGC